MRTWFWTCSWPCSPHSHRTERPLHGPFWISPRADFRAHTESRCRSWRGLTALQCGGCAPVAMAQAGRSSIWASLRGRGAQMSSMCAPACGKVRGPGAPAWRIRPTMSACAKRPMSSASQETSPSAARRGLRPPDHRSAAARPRRLSRGLSARFRQSRPRRHRRRLCQDTAGETGREHRIEDMNAPACDPGAVTIRPAPDRRAAGGLVPHSRPGR